MLYIPRTEDWSLLFPFGFIGSKGAAGGLSNEHKMSYKRHACRSCASMLSDFALFEALKSEAGVDISQTAQEFYSAVDHGCLVCSVIHDMACGADYSETAASLSAAFRCRPELPSSNSRDLIKNIQLETTRPGSCDVKSVRVAIWSAKNRYNFDRNFYVEAQEGKYKSSKACRSIFGCFSDNFEKTIRQQSTSALGR